jgi:AcrR family transcriptional regulator
MPKARKPRRTNEERSAETRGRLLDATIECLYELGYAGTTTTAVCERAGVSRGAQLHHFPTKRELVTTAVEHLLEVRLQEFRRTFAAAKKNDPDPLKLAINMLWKGVDSPAFYAWLEIATAARTDADLRKTCARIDREFNLAVKATFREIFGFAPDAKSPLDDAPSFALLFLDGLALDKMIVDDEQKTARMLKILRAVARMSMQPR